MTKQRRRRGAVLAAASVDGYEAVLGDILQLLESARRASSRVLNTLMTATYWEIGRRIVEFEQGGSQKAGYGEELLERLAVDLRERFGRGFGRENLRLMRQFYNEYPVARISRTASGKSTALISQTVSGKFGRPDSDKSSLNLRPDPLTGAFPLPWSHYVRLMRINKSEARRFYETEALRGGWTVRQLDRQIGTLFYERTLASRDKAALLNKGTRPTTDEPLRVDQEIKDPFILEFLGLKDEYSETELEEALIRQLETFLLELGGDFAFIGRQRRLRIGDEWYRIDLLFFHRRLRCLVVIDLKLGKFTHADAGQMHLYLNYANEHWTNPGENPAVGLVLCTYKDEAVAHYALDNLPNKVLAAEYRLALPDERTLEAELARSRCLLESRRPSRSRRGKRGKTSLEA